MNENEELREMYIHYLKEKYEPHVSSDLDLKRFEEVDQKLSESDRVKARLEATTNYIEELKSYELSSLIKEVEPHQENLKSLAAGIYDFDSYLPHEQSDMYGLKMPKHNEISDLKVITHSTGHFIGREQYNRDLEDWAPYNQISNNIKSYEDAERLLKRAHEFKKAIEPIGTSNLKSISNDLSKRLNEDPYNGLKRNLINDTLQIERQYNKEISLQPVHELSR